MLRNILLQLGLLKYVRRVRTKIELLLGKGYYVKVKKKYPTIYMGSYHAGYNICPNNLKSTSIVYSFGLGDDISFDLDLIKKYSCHVYGSDPTPKSVEFIKSSNLSKLFHHFEYAIADYDGEIELFSPKIKIMFLL